VEKASLGFVFVIDEDKGSQKNDEKEGDQRKLEDNAVNLEDSFGTLIFRNNKMTTGTSH